MLSSVWFFGRKVWTIVRRFVQFLSFQMVSLFAEIKLVPSVFGRKPWTMVRIRRFDQILYALIAPDWKVLRS